MMAVGLVLIFFGWFSAQIARPHYSRWELRDLFSTIPILIGFLLCFASAVVFLWRTTP